MNVQWHSGAGCKLVQMCRLNGALAKKTAHVARLVQHQRHMAVKIEKHVTNMVDNVKQQGQADRDKALAAQTTQHTQQLQSLQQQHAAHLQNLSSKQNAQPQNRVAQSSDAKRKQYYAWLQDQVTSCKAELGVQKQRSSPALLQQSSSMSQSQLAQPTEQQQRCQADLQSKIAGLQKAMEECKAHMQQPSVVELQQHVSQLEEQLQNDRTELQRHRAQPTTAQLQQRVTQLETALKQQSDGFADQMQKVQTGVEKAKKSFFHSAQLREDDLKQRHAATLTAQDEMLKCQASKVTRCVLSVHCLNTTGNRWLCVTSLIFCQLSLVRSLPSRCPYALGQFLF